MEKKVTKEEVERVLSNYKEWFVSTKKEAILNELFPSELEDNRVNIAEYSSAGCDGMLRYVKSITAHNGHYFKTNEDGTEVTLHKRD